VVRQSGLRDAFRIELPRNLGGILCRAIVPGWPQFYLGQSFRGRVFLGVYLALMLLALLFFGTRLGMFLAGLAFSIHVASCVSVLHLAGLRGFIYACGVLMTFLILALGVYTPVGWGISRVVSPAELWFSGAMFEIGDVVLYSPLYYSYREPRPGDVVLYDQRGGTWRVPNNIYIQPGQRIDRILAGPGDRIVWENGHLTVNGQPSTLEPLNPNAMIPRFAVDVPQGYYLILPTLGRPLPQALYSNEQVWKSLTVVPLGAIRGPIFFRSSPLYRIRRIS
jgi:hypothetical protein